MNKKYLSVVLSLAFASSLLLPATNVFAASKWKAPSAPTWKAPSHKWTAPAPTWSWTAPAPTWSWTAPAAPTTLTVYSVEPAATPWTTIYEIVPTSAPWTTPEYVVVPAGSAAPVIPGYNVTAA